MLKANYLFSRVAGMYSWARVRIISSIGNEVGFGRIWGCSQSWNPGRAYSGTIIWERDEGSLWGWFQETPRKWNFNGLVLILFVLKIRISDKWVPVIFWAISRWETLIYIWNYWIWTQYKYQHFSGEVVLDGWVFWVFPSNLGAVLTMLSTVDC